LRPARLRLSSADRRKLRCSHEDITQLRLLILP
jgi:hypothetical protein